VDEVSVDTTVLLFAVIVSIASGVLFGLAPALRATPNLATWLGQGGRSGSQGRDHGRLRMGLATAQIALSCVLLIGAGLLLRSFMALQDVSPGIRSENLLIAQVSLSGERYRDDTATRTFYRELLDGVLAIPGVETATLSSTVPPGQGGFSENITIEGSRNAENPVVLLPIVHPEYFRTMGIPLMAGRYFTAADTAESPRVTMISETMARRYYPDQNAVGRRLRIGGRERPDAPWLEVIGVVGDVRYRGLDVDAEPVFYVPHAQNTMRAMYLVLRTSLPPSSLRSAVGQQVAALDSKVPFPEFHRVEDLLYESVAQPRFRTVLVAGFAFVALAIAGVGLYGVMAYGVTRRVREIGIRIALGAQSGAVLSMILREAGMLALIGMTAGIAGALALQRLVSGFLFGIAATDVPTFAGVLAVLSGTCLLASYIPARRAARVDPLISLKAE
jgi:putative ABC transport system permease protein